MTLNPAMFSSARQDWRTPPGWLARTLDALGLPWPALDLAASSDSTLAPAWYGPDHPNPARRDALGTVRAWSAAGLAWLNPPYGRTCTVCPGGEWRAGRGVPHAERCSTLGHASRTVDAWMERVHEACVVRVDLLVLVPARTDTAWWHRHVHGVARTVYLVRGRLRFDGTAAGAPFPSALIHYRDGVAGETRYAAIAGERER